MFEYVHDGNRGHEPKEVSQACRVEVRFRLAFQAVIESEQERDKYSRYYNVA